MATGSNRTTPSGLSAPRAAALRAVRRVVEEGAYSNLAVPSELDRAGLRGRDRAFASELAFGTIRSLIRVDAALADASTRALEDVDPDVLAVLRLGAHQLLFTRVPAHAAVAETVALAGARQRGFVNAVLRSLARKGWQPPSSNDDHGVSLRTGMAEWAIAEVRRLLADHEVEPAAAALASPAGLSLRANTCRASVDELEAALVQGGHAPQRGSFHPDVLRVRGGPPSGLPGYQEGWFGVQDEASALVASALGIRSGERVLDACAGPGGKAGQLACEAGPGGLAVASDVHARRARLVRSTADRLGVSVHLLVQDARRPALALGTFDAVLVDAPCSGLGAARRRPELLWRPSRDRLSELARLQVSILATVAGLVRPGGRLLYSVCTFPRAETEAAVRAFRARRPEFEPLAVPGPDGDAPVHRLWPHRHRTDAMFFAGFIRR